MQPYTILLRAAKKNTVLFTITEVRCYEKNPFKEHLLSLMLEEIRILTKPPHCHHAFHRTAPAIPMNAVYSPRS